MTATAAAVIAAAGRGERLGGAVPKAFIPLAGQPMLTRAVLAVEASPAVGAVVVVVGENHVAQARALLDAARIRKVTAVVPGGSSRQESVFAGLSAVDDAPVIVVHDGARPFVSPDVVTAVVQAAAQTGAASAGVPLRETVKVVEGTAATTTLDRDRLWVAHTPQAFHTDLLRDAHRQARSAGVHATDDAMLVERLGRRVQMVEDVPQNVKITVPADLTMAEALLRPDAEPAVRTGIGYDVHPLAPDRRLRIGGVDVPWSRGLAGYSDADVLAHAIMDALLGAAGLGDIGRHFPTGDPAYKDADSLALLGRAGALVAAAGWRIAHVDSVIMAEAPRMAPFVDEMRRRLAEAMGVDPGAVNVKAATNEGLGWIGRGEGIAAQAVATLIGIRDQGSVIRE